MSKSNGNGSVPRGAPTTSNGRSRHPIPLETLHNIRPELTSKRVLPIVNFPGQGNGRSSEYHYRKSIFAFGYLKIVYFLFFAWSVLFFYLPYWILLSLLPSRRGRPSWTPKKSVAVRFFQHAARLTWKTQTNFSRDVSVAVPHEHTKKGKFVWIDAAPKGDIRGEVQRAMKVQGVEAVRTCGFWFGKPLEGTKLAQAEAPASGVGRRAGVDEKVFYHCHGGAYLIGTAHEKDFTSAISTQILRHLENVYGKAGAKSGKPNRCTRTLSLDYRVSVPRKPNRGAFPAALLDALAGYLYLVRHCGFKSSNIIVVGDSAGGNLALALCRYLRDEKVEEMPGSLLLLSPWSDISRSHSGPTGAINPFSSSYMNRHSDVLPLGDGFRNLAVSAFMGNLPTREAYENPYISSCSLQLLAAKGGDGPTWGYEGFPKEIYIVSGGAEMLHDQNSTIAHRMAANTRSQRPTYVGSQQSKGLDAHEEAARLQFPRPKEYGIHWNSTGSDPPGQLTMSSALNRALAGKTGDEEALAEAPSGAEDRHVWFDEVPDGIHDCLVFEFNEPERGQCWQRIAEWIDAN